MKCIVVYYLRLVTASPWMGGPGRVGQIPAGVEVKQLNRKRAFFKHTAENSRVGAGMAADWVCVSRLEQVYWLEQ